jgi:myo-inositol 2-dehydrogenase/D-chiro-inositol 1-dehydrogenase
MRVGIVGAGRIGALHAETLIALPGVSVVIGDARPAAARELAARHGADATDDISELIAGADALVVAAATDAHPDLVGRGVAAGLPIYCEKPLARDLETARRLVTTVEDAGGFVQMGFQRRFDEGFRAVAGMVADGSLGTLYMLRTTTNDPAPPSAEYVARSGGLFVDCLIHDLDLVRFVGRREVVDVSAHGQVLIDDMFREHDDVDVGAAVLHLEGGGMAIASATRHHPLGHDVRLEALGSRDSVVAGDDTRTPLRRMSVGAGPERPYTDFQDRFRPAYRAALAAFVESVRDGGTSPCTVADALAAQQIAAACERSRREGRTTRVDEVV